MLLFFNARPGRLGCFTAIAAYSARASLWLGFYGQGRGFPGSAESWPRIFEYERPRTKEQAHGRGKEGIEALVEAAERRGRGIIEGRRQAIDRAKSWNSATKNARCGEVMEASGRGESSPIAADATLGKEWHRESRRHAVFAAHSVYEKSWTRSSVRCVFGRQGLLHHRRSGFCPSARCAKLVIQ